MIQTVEITGRTTSIYLPLSNAPITADDDFDLIAVTPCGLGISLVTINTTPQSNQFDDDYSGAEKVFTYNPFIIVPDYCGVVVTCESVAPESLGLPCQELDPENKLKWTFTEDDYKN